MAAGTGLAAVFAALVAAAPAAAQDRPVVDASEPSALAVTVYRNPSRRPGQQLDRDWPEGFAMISETRTVTLPPGRSTVRFEGVAEGMVAVSAIVTGLPGGTIEKNRNADLLSPAALVDGTLGNRVRITRTNPGSGAEVTEPAIVRTRADGGLVLQTAEGYEAVRCSGLPEKLTFDRLPEGLSAQPVFTIDTRAEAAGMHEVTLTYLAAGFDWQANYVATLAEVGDGGNVRLALRSWLTILNDNGQSFPDAELMAVAGILSVTSNYAGLADPPRAEPLRLTCYPLGSSLAGSIPPPPPPPPPRPAAPAQYAARADAIVVTGARMPEAEMAMMAAEEQLGDLKLYRVPEPVTVAAQGLKQVAFLDREDVQGRFLYTARCEPRFGEGELQPAGILFATVNDEEHGLGAALPTGSVAFFESSPRGDLLVGEQTVRDYAEGQDVEIALGESAQLFARCERLEREARGGVAMRAVLTNANPAPARLRLDLGLPGGTKVEGLETRVKDGRRIAELTVPANGRRVLRWRVRTN